MKHALFLIILVFSITTDAQKIRVSEVDKFNGLRRIETGHTVIVMKWNQAIDLKIRSADTAIYIFLRGESGVVGADDLVTFLLNNGDRVQCRSTGVQGATSDGGFQYRIALKDVERMAKSKATDMRINTTSGYDDFKVKSGEAANLQKLFSIFLDEYNKYFPATSDAVEKTR